ncbi:hypothetical protein YC2023_066230 [Brassica napus]
MSVQYTQDVLGSPPAHTARLWLSVAVRQHTQDVRGCPCVSVGVRQHTQDVRSCLWLSVSTHRTSVCVRQHTQDVCVCPCVPIRTHRTSVAVHQYTYQHAGPWTQHAVPSCGLFGTSVAVRVCPCVSVSTHRTSVAVHHTHRTSVGVRQHTQYVRVCQSAHTGHLGLSVCVRVCPSAHTGRLWLSISTHINTLYTQDVRGCLPAHTGRLWLSVCVRVCPSVSVSTQRTSVAVHHYTYQHVGPWTQHAGTSRGLFGTSVAVRQHTQDVRDCPCVSVYVRVCPCVSVSTHRTSVGVRQYTYQHIGPWTQHADPSRGQFGTSGAVRVCLCVSVSTHRTFVADDQYTYQHVGAWTQHVDPSRGLFGTHISTLVLGLSMLTLPVDCLGDFGPRGMSVQYTQDVLGSPPAHTARLWLSVAVRQHTQDVRGCPCVSVGVRQHTQDVRSCLWLSVSTHRTSVCVRQHTQDVCVCPCVPIRTHRTSVAVHQYTYQHAGPWTQHAVPSCGLFGTSVAVRVCPCMSVSTHRTSVAVHHTHRTSVGVRQHTQYVRVCQSAHTGHLGLSVCVRVCPSAHTGRLWLSISTHINTLVLGLSTLTLPADCLGDFGPRGLCVQYTQDVRGCLPAHTVLPWLSVCVCVCPSVSVSTQRTSVAVHQYTYQHVVHTGRPWLSTSTHRTSVAIHQYTYQHAGPWSQHAGPSSGLFGLFWPTWAVCSVNTGRLWVSASTHRTSVGVRQHTQDVCGGPCVSVCVCVCPSAHTGRPWLSISTHISTLAFPVYCSGNFGRRGLSVQYTRRPWVSVSTHRTSMGVRQHTQDVHGCPSAHTRRSWLSVCVRVCPAAHTGCPWLSISTHISTLYTQDVRGCLPAHTGRLWLSVCVRVCLSVSVSTQRTSVAVHHYTYQHVGPWTQHAGTSRGLFGTSVAVRQHTQDVRDCPCVSVYVRVCPSAHTGRLWVSVSTHISTLVLGLSTLTLPVDCSGRPGLSVCVCVCPSAHTGRSWLTISTHISMLVLGLSTLTLPVDCSGDFGPRGLSGQYTQDGSVCPPAHTGHPWLSVCVRVCSSVSVSKHRTSMAVHQYTYQHVGPWAQHADPSRGLFG